MKVLQFSFVFGLVLVQLFVHAHGFRFYGPYDVYKTRAARWPSTRETSNADRVGLNENGFLNEPETEQDYIRIISHLNDIGKRRRR